MDFCTIDFETTAIGPRPHYPPEPVGVSIKYSGKKAHYYAWGHPTGNNCLMAEAIGALRAVWDSGLEIVCHNTKFDYEEAVVKLGLPELPWQRLHDTMFLLFLHNPYASSFKLKPASERLLNMPPEEQDAVRDYLWEHRKELKEKYNINVTEANFGAFISLAPGDLVGKYADGDVIRTEKLFTLLLKDIKKRKMMAAYDTERELMPILLKLEQQGVPVDLKRLRADVTNYISWLDKIDVWLGKQLKVKVFDRKKDKKTNEAEGRVNLNNGDQLVEALIQVDKIDESLVERTDTGKWSSDKDSLAVAVTDKALNGILQYRAQLQTCVGTFMSAWLEVAEQTKGFIYTSWNQTRSADGKNSTGTRTGRLSSSPNFQNIPKEFKPIFRHEQSDAKLAKLLPACPIKGLPSLPLCRSYIVPWDKTQILIDRDYSQQELRILGHFEGEALLDAYVADPWLDVHDFATNLMQGEYGLFANLSHDKARKPVKNTGFGLIYGMGIGKLAMKSDISVDEAKKVKDAYLAIFPGLKAIYSEMKARAKANEPIRTWGGREYYCEEPKIINGRLQTYDYKMVNTLIQGSAADCTKRAIIQLFNEMFPVGKDGLRIGIRKGMEGWHLLLTVHDEVLMSAPVSAMAEAMELMRVSLESVGFSVPMLSEGTVSKINWAVMEDYDKKGKLVYNQKKGAKK
jgi:DNA polymerase I-like protein with 3'-5' exonuclease and polymerase domains